MPGMLNQNTQFSSRDKQVNGNKQHSTSYAQNGTVNTRKSNEDGFGKVFEQLGDNYPNTGSLKKDARANNANTMNSSFNTSGYTPVSYATSTPQNVQSDPISVFSSPTKSGFAYNVGGANPNNNNNTHPNNQINDANRGNSYSSKIPYQPKTMHSNPPNPTNSASNPNNRLNHYNPSTSANRASTLLPARTPYNNPPQNNPPQNNPPQNNPPQNYQPNHLQQNHLPQNHLPQNLMPQNHPPQNQLPQNHQSQSHHPQNRPPQTRPPQSHPPQSHPPQSHPPQSHPPQSHLPQSHPSQNNPPQNHVPQSHPPQNNPTVIHTSLNNPPISHPLQSHPPHSHPPQSHPPKNNPPINQPQNNPRNNPTTTQNRNLVQNPPIQNNPNQPNIPNSNPQMAANRAIVNQYNDNNATTPTPNANPPKPFDEQLASDDDFWELVIPVVTAPASSSPSPVLVPVHPHQNPDLPNLNAPPTTGNPAINPSPNPHSLNTQSMRPNSPPQAQAKNPPGKYPPPNPNMQNQSNPHNPPTNRGAPTHQPPLTRQKSFLAAYEQQQQQQQSHPHNTVPTPLNPPNKPNLPNPHNTTAPPNRLPNQTNKSHPPPPINLQAHPQLVNAESGVNVANHQAEKIPEMTFTNGINVTSNELICATVPDIGALVPANRSQSNLSSDFGNGTDEDSVPALKQKLFDAQEHIKLMANRMHNDNKSKVDPKELEEKSAEIRQLKQTIHTKEKAFGEKLQRTEDELSKQVQHLRNELKRKENQDAQDAMELQQLRQELAEEKAKRQRLQIEYQNAETSLKRARETISQQSAKKVKVDVPPPALRSPAAVSPPKGQDSALALTTVPAAPAPASAPAATKSSLALALVGEPGSALANGGSAIHSMIKSMLLTPITKTLDSGHTMKKVLDNSSGFFQLLQYSALPLPPVTPSSYLPPQHPTSPPHPLPLLHPSSDAAHEEGQHAPLSRANSNSSEPSSPPAPPSSPSHIGPHSSQLFSQLATELSSCVSSISSGSAQCRSMLPILYEFVVNGDDAAVDYALDVIYILVSTCDDCKQALFSPSERLDSFLENKKPSTSLPPTHTITTTSTTVNTTQMGVILPVPTDIHELGDGILLKRNQTFTNPRTFTKPTSTQPPSLSSSISPITPISPTHLDPTLGFITPTDPRSVLLPALAQSSPQPVCELLPYLIRNFNKFTKSRKTLVKILSIFCVVTWCVDESSLLWFTPLVSQEGIWSLFNSKYLEVKEKMMELLNQLLRATEIYKLAQLPYKEGKEAFSILEKAAVLLSSNRHGARHKVRQLRHNALQVLFGVVNYKDGIKVLLKTEELVIRATSMMLLGELEDLCILKPDPLSISLIKDGMHLFRLCACRLDDLTAHVGSDRHIFQSAMNRLCSFAKHPTLHMLHDLVPDAERLKGMLREYKNDDTWESPLTQGD